MLSNYGRGGGGGGGQWEEYKEGGGPDFGLLVFLYSFSSERDNRKFCRLTHKGLRFLGESFKPKLLLLKYFLMEQKLLLVGFVLFCFEINFCFMGHYWSNGVLQ